MQTRDRIRPHNKSRGGDPGKSTFANCVKRSNKSLTEGQGDICRHHLANVLAVRLPLYPHSPIDYPTRPYDLRFLLSYRDRRFVEELLHGIHNVMEAMQQFDEYDTENLARGTRLMEKELDGFFRYLPGAFEFCSFPNSPGREIDRCRVEIRKLERYCKQYSENRDVLRFLNRASEYLFWLSWKCHYQDPDILFRRRADFDLI